MKVDEHLLYHVFKKYGEVTKISIKALIQDKVPWLLRLLSPLIGYKSKPRLCLRSLHPEPHRLPICSGRRCVYGRRHVQV
jgi:hypothetical protein